MKDLLDNRKKTENKSEEMKQTESLIQHIPPSEPDEGPETEKNIDLSPKKPTYQELKESEGTQNLNEKIGVQVEIDHDGEHIHIADDSDESEEDNDES